MNMKSRTGTGPTRAGICLAAGILGFVSHSFGAETTATGSGYELKIIENTLGGSEIMAGDYSAAIEQLHFAPSLDSEYVKNTNLCVAYTARGEFTLAEKHCKTALRTSDSEDTGIQNTGWSARASKDNQAMALINIGVLQALQGNTQEARKYFESASSGSGHLRETSHRNINELQRRDDSLVSSS